MSLTEQVMQAVQTVYHAAKDYATSKDLLREYENQLDKNIQHGLFPYSLKHDPREHYQK